MNVNNLPLISNQAAEMSFSTKSVKSSSQAVPGFTSTVSSGETTEQAPVGTGAGADPVIIEKQMQESKDKLDRAMEQIKAKTKEMNYSVDMRYDERINRTITRIIDKETGTVIKEIPPEELVKVAVMISNMIEGIIIDNQA
jgi:flagellar protein FlaG